MADIDDWVKENYEALVSDGQRTFEEIADWAEDHSKDLAAWARQKAAESGEDVIPDEATPKPKQTREAGADNKADQTPPPGDAQAATKQDGAS